MRKKVCIGDLGTIVTGNTPPRNRPELYGNHTPFIKATDISESEKYTYNPEECYSEEGYNKYIKSLIPKGSTCVVTIGSIGKKMTMAHCDLFINQAMNAIIPNACFDSEYVYYAVKNVLGNIKTLDSGTASGRENVSKSVFSKMEIWVEEELPIQQRIATILSRYDSLIENYQKQIKLLEESAQRLYKEWFIDFRFPGHENTKIVNGVPEGWEKKKVCDIVKIKSGFAFKSKDWQKQGCPVVKIKDISGIFVNTDSLDYVSSNVALNAQHYLLNKMDLVIAMTGATIGKIGLITDDCLYANQRVGKFFLQNTIDVPYLYCFFKQTTSIEQIVQISSASSAQPNISGNQLESFKILFNVNILKEFNLKCYKYFKQMIHLYSQIRHATEARDRLLPKLMSGELII